MPRLVFARGDEPFDTVRDGVPVVEHPETGEVVWRDQQGVTCRGWNWRQFKRTALGPASRNLWCIIDRLPPMPVAEMQRAGEELVTGLARLSPEITYAIDLLAPNSALLT